jgi:FkbM family methyltransferase
MPAFAAQVARVLPQWLKDFVHSNNALDTGLRRMYGWSLGKGSAAIPDGPMKGIQLALGEHVSHAHLNGTYERELLDAVDQALKPGMVCYDVGASIGYISLLMASRAQKVYSFEPAPHAIAEIKKHCAANNLSNVEVVPQPVSDSVKTVQFQITDTAYGSAIGSGDSRWKQMTFETTSLDLFAQTHELPDLIKMDIEGEEGRALEGARKILTEKRPTLICEIHSNEQARHVGKVLEECGYSIFSIDGQHPFVAKDNIVAGLVQVVAVPKQTAGRKMAAGSGSV